MTILFFGDIVGRPGRKAVCHALPHLKERFDPDLIVANAENSAGGSGISSSTLRKLASYGVEVFTSGDHFFRNKEYAGVVDDPRVLRPVNYPPQAPGRGWGLYKARGGVEVAVVNAMGRIFMEALECPFAAMDRALGEIGPQARVILVDFHAEATSEKMAMAWYLNGRVSALVGTHTHVQTADERILNGGTACISDLGMSGPYDSVIGRSKEAVLHRLTTGVPARFEVTEGEEKACGVVLKIDAESGKALGIERFQVALKDVLDASKDDED
ncbi:MAG: TIGR00282 family metallophosphoesterase [Planctomycetota bacterium]|nr:TIGR00282 family metallophosphoesterase [Planctomycetota bacterium]